MLLLLVGVAEDMLLAEEAEEAVLY